MESTLIDSLGCHEGGVLCLRCIMLILTAVENVINL